MAEEKKSMAEEKKSMAEEKKKSPRGKAPSRGQINFIKKEVQKVDVGKRITAIALTAVVLLAAGGYGFMRWRTVNGLRNQVEQMNEELASMKLISATYDEITAEYIRYSTAYETAAERMTQDSRVLIDKTRELVEPFGYITDISVDGNSLQVMLYSMDISKVTDSLNNDPDKMVSMVIPLTEQKEKYAASGGTQSPPSQPGETGD